MLIYYIGGQDPTTTLAYAKGIKFSHVGRASEKAYLMDSVFPQASDGSEITGSGLPNWSTKDYISCQMGIYGVGNNGNKASRRRHGESSNVFFPDGHTENITARELLIKRGSGWADSVMYGKTGLR